MTGVELFEAIGQVGVGAAVGFGTFVGYVRANMKSMREVLTRVEAKIDRLDQKVDTHSISIARIDARCKAKTDPCWGRRRDAPDPPP